MKKKPYKKPAVSKVKKSDLLAPLMTELGKLSRSVEDMNQEIGLAVMRIDRLESLTAGVKYERHRFDEAQRLMSETMSRLDAFSKRLDSNELETGLQEVRHAVEGLDISLDEHANRLKELETHSDLHNGRLDDVEAKLEETADDVADVEGRVEELEEHVLGEESAEVAPTNEVDERQMPLPMPVSTKGDA